MQPLTLLGAEVVAGVAMMQSERDTLLGLLRQVLDHECPLPTGGASLLVLLPRALADEIREAVL